MHLYEPLLKLFAYHHESTVGYFEIAISQYIEIIPPGLTMGVSAITLGQKEEANRQIVKSFSCEQDRPSGAAVPTDKCIEVISARLQIYQKLSVFVCGKNCPGVEHPC